MNKGKFYVQVIRQNNTRIYLLAAMLSARKKTQTGLAPEHAGLLNVLDIAMKENLKKSVLAFLNSGVWPFLKQNCPQKTIIEPTVYGISKFTGEFWMQLLPFKYGVDVSQPALSASYPTIRRRYHRLCELEIFSWCNWRKRNMSLFLEETLICRWCIPGIRATIELMEAPAENISIRWTIIFLQWVFAKGNRCQRLKNIPSLEIAPILITGSRLPIAGHKVLTIR